MRRRNRVTVVAIMLKVLLFPAEWYSVAVQKQCVV